MHTIKIQYCYTIVVALAATIVSPVASTETASAKTPPMGVPGEQCLAAGAVADNALGGQPVVCQGSSLSWQVSTSQCPIGSMWVLHAPPPKAMPDRDPHLPRCALTKQVSPFEIIDAKGNHVAYAISKVQAANAIEMLKRDYSPQLRIRENPDLTSKPN